VALIGGPEAAIEALGRVIHQYLYTYLEAEWTAAGDVATCPKPYPSSWSSSGVHVTTYDVPQPEYPVVWITGMGGQIGADAAPVWGDYTHNLNVQSRMNGDDKIVLSQQALRFTWAIVRCIQHRQPELKSTIAGGIAFVPQRYSLFPDNGSGNVEMVSNVIVAVVVEESF